MDFGYLKTRAVISLGFSRPPVNFQKMGLWFRVKVGGLLIYIFFGSAAVAGVNLCLAGDITSLIENGENYVTFKGFDGVRLKTKGN